MLPEDAARNLLGVAFAVGFTVSPIPGFILLGLALEGPARAGTYRQTQRAA